MTQKTSSSFISTAQCLPEQIKRTIFKAIDPYLECQDYLFKTKKSHFRHISQPLEQEKNEFDEDELPPKSIQQTLRKARYKGCHQRIVSQISQHSPHHNTKKAKYNQFQYNKWYIKPEFRLKKPTIKRTQYNKRFIETENLKSSFANFRQSNFTQKNSSSDPFDEKEDCNVLFAKDFVNQDKKHLNLLKEFKKKQAFKRHRTPELVDLILQMNKGKKQNIKSSAKNTKSSSKISSFYQQSASGSKMVSKLMIQESDMMRIIKSRNGTKFNKQKKRLTLLQSQYTIIKNNIKKDLQVSYMQQGFRIQRFGLK